MGIEDVFRDAVEEVELAAAAYASFEADCNAIVERVAESFPGRLGATPDKATIAAESRKLDEYRCIATTATLDLSGVRVTVPVRFEFKQVGAKAVVINARGDELGSFDPESASGLDKLFATIVNRAKAIALHRLHVP